MEKFVTVRWFKIEKVHDTLKDAQQTIENSKDNPLYKDQEIITLSSPKQP